MDLRTAKDLLHIDEWLRLAAQIVEHGELAYLSDPLLQEAGDALMMKLGEAARRLQERGVTAPPGIAWRDASDNRNLLIHEYDRIKRTVAWRTLADALPRWRIALAPMIREARHTVDQR